MPNSGDQKAGFVTAFGVFPGSPYSLFLGHFWSGYQKEQGFFFVPLPVSCTVLSCTISLDFVSSAVHSVLIVDIALLRVDFCFVSPFRIDTFGCYSVENGSDGG